MSILTTNEAPRTVFYALAEESPAGPLLIGLTQDGFVCRVAFAGARQVNATLRAWHSEWPRTSFIEDPQKIALLAKRIKEAKGGLPPLLLCGSDFQIKVWLALLDIGQGETVSYGELAKRIGSARASRAVGGACGKNPIPFFIPCHRVIASDGTIGGFSGPMKIKKALLEMETSPKVATRKSTKS